MNNVRKYLPIYTFTLILVIYSLVLPATIFKWTDKQGQEHFSDLPPNNDAKVELLEVQRHDNTDRIINQTSKKSTNNYTNKIKSYKKIKEHHSDENVSPMIQNLKNTSGSLKKQDIINKNCEIAQNNLAQLDKSDVILKENNKLDKLSKSKHQSKIKTTQKQVTKFCS